MRLVLLAPATRLNALTFKYFTILGTHNFAHGLLVLLQLLLHSLALILKEKKAGSSTLTIIVLLYIFYYSLKYKLMNLHPLELTKMLIL